MERFAASERHFIESLQKRLGGPLPGEEIQCRMAPAMRPRRVDAVAGAGTEQQSAVLIHLFPKWAEWHCLLMKRPDYDGVHSGQVSIPGGRLEPGETHQQAALREFEEEIGVVVDHKQLLGGLSTLFIPPSNFLVHPFVAYALVAPVCSPDPAEVEQVIELPLARLMSNDILKRGRVQLRGGDWVESPYFDVGGQVVWGATAMILSEFKEILRSLD